MMPSPPSFALAAAAALPLITIALPAVSADRQRQAVALPTGSWAGIDGNWSTTELAIGSEHQTVDVLVSTALSELWVVGPGGCTANEPRCASHRGSLFDPSRSSRWEALGIWQLSLQYLGIKANGEYGMDTVYIDSDALDGGELALENTLTAVINTTNPYLGLFGLGINQASFDSDVITTPLISAVQESKLIPSYSYGFTAGAHYRNIPASVTLGGYDSARFVDHNVDFATTVDDNLARTLVRAIEVQKASDDSDSSTTISHFNSSFTALIDTSTPFLWFPDSVCESFSDALGLTWNETLDVYTITDDQYQEYMKPDSYNFTFTLSDANNYDTLGNALETSGVVVNITVPIRAFVSTLQYPYKDEIIKYGDPAIPYFVLRKSGRDSTIAIGRSFFQEAYMLTKYTEATFSIHQARFPDDPIGDADIVTIDDGFYSDSSGSDKKLSGGVIGGIVVGAFSGLALLLTPAWWFWRRRRRQQKQAAVDAAGGDEAASSGEDKKSVLSNKARSSPVGRVLGIFSRRLRPSAADDIREEKSIPEAPEHHQIYEMPAPLPPVELDASGIHNDVPEDDDGTALGLDDPHQQQQSTYERARIRLDRQLAGPVPEYSPPQDGTSVLIEKDGAGMERSDSHTRQQLSHSSTMGSTISSIAPSDDRWASQGNTTSSSGYVQSEPSSGATLATPTVALDLPVPSQMQKQPIDTSKVIKETADDHPSIP
ncbi:Eukaryotic aspartyl protease [Geosmithia morbida]|uniref:Eukaryotic aspartyl protease n=1 Tax=Geosmithia morbida TaxID=1094350 RepID=A0A9P4YXU5_9HYPO|nr:Eukaryotic aspartyl protease [Geosmithia morbida]KAF4123774.1 Eukaryotic aspartyl protease [Geosmithia morbida]